MARMPVLFLSHGGGPCFFMETKPGDMFHDVGSRSSAAAWFRGLPAQLGLDVPKPKAIVVFSAHWLTGDGVRVTAQDRYPSLLYDYGGFPEYTYAPALTYPAPGNSALASQVLSLLQAAGIKSFLDHSRNLDHGSFIPLKLMYPDADVPIIQVSLLKSLDPVAHVAIGAALVSLRDQGVLFVGSGSSIHSFRASAEQGVEFDRALTEALTKSPADQRLSTLVEWRSLPFAERMHPPEEHLVPLHCALGAAGSDAGRLVGTYIMAGQTLSNYVFSSTA